LNTAISDGGPERLRFAIRAPFFPDFKRLAAAPRTFHA